MNVILSVWVCLTCAARLTFILEYGASHIWSRRSLGHKRTPGTLVSDSSRYSASMCFQLITWPFFCVHTKSARVTSWSVCTLCVYCVHVCVCVLCGCTCVCVCVCIVWVWVRAWFWSPLIAMITCNSLDRLWANELLKQFLVVLIKCGGSQKKYRSQDFWFWKGQNLASFHNRCGKIAGLEILHQQWL